MRCRGSVKFYLKNKMVRADLLVCPLLSGLQIHDLAMKLALQKSQNAELQSQFEGLNVAHPCLFEFVQFFLQIF